MNADALRMLKHELRTPVNHIIGYSELLLETAEDDGMDDLAGQARTIRACGQQLAELIERHFSRVTAESVEVNHSALISATSPVMEKVLSSTQTPEGVRDERSTGDLARINSAASRLASIIVSLKN